MSPRAAACALAVVAWAALGARPAGALECARYEPATVQLDGELHLTVFPGPPHYKSFDTGDQPESIWLLALSRPLCIESAPEDADNAPASDVRVVEVVSRAPLAVGLNGKAVTVEGMLFRPRGGHPHATVMLRATRATPRP